jgi:hypothetical protein
VKQRVPRENRWTVRRLATPEHRRKLTAPTTLSHRTYAAWKFSSAIGARIAGEHLTVVVSEAYTNA